MPQRTAYAGRHRGRHRAEVRRSSGVALPGAAAAALTLTATGAAVFPGLSGSAAASDQPIPGDQPAQKSHAMSQEGSATDQMAEAALAENLREARVQAQERASRAQARAAIEKKRKLALAAAHKWVLPLSHFRFSSDYGMRWGRLHAGNDFAAPIGTKVGSISSGTVVFAGRQSGYGNKVEVRHWDGTVSWYAHMSSIAVHVGEKVGPGDKLGEVGNTGHSTGPHLHLEIHPAGGGPVDPTPWLAKHGLKT